MFTLSIAGDEAARAAVIRTLPATVLTLSEKILQRLRVDDVAVTELSVLMGEGQESQILFWHTLNVLSLYGCVETSVTFSDQVLLTVSGATPMLFPAPAGEVVRMSRLAAIRPDGTNLVVETPLAHAVVTIVSEQAAVFCAQLARGVSRTLPPGLNVDQHTYEEMIVCFAAIGGLSDTDEAATKEYVQWEHHDAMFHARTRGRTRGNRGGTYRFSGERAPTKAVPQRDFGPPIAVGGGAVSEGLASLNELMLQRRSVRKYGTVPMSLAELGMFLHCVGRTLELHPIDEAAGLTYETVRRPYPGAGACHELELYPVVNRCNGLEAGAYWYNSIDDTLHLVGKDDALIGQMLDRAGRSLGIYPGRPDILVSVAARFGRVNWKYEGIAYAVVLKDVGVLLHAMYLVATAMGLAGCAVGIGDSRHFTSLTRISPFEEDAVGEFALGST